MQTKSGMTLCGMACCLALASPGALAEDVPLPAAPDVPAQTFHVAAVPAVARIQRQGLLKIGVSLVASASLPAGTSILVTASAGSTDTAYTDQATIYGRTTIAAGKAAVTVQIPYTWLFASTADKVIIYVYVTGYTPTAGNSSFFTETIPLPANGATTILSFAGSI